MFWQKVEHYLKFSFLLLLILTQALIFVAVRASDNSRLISASFVSPISGQIIEKGQLIYLEAYLENENQANFSLVYFNVQNPSLGYNQNFEANRSTAGTWLASASLDTSELSSGYYWISVQAYEYGQNSVDSYYSEPYLFAVGGDSYQAAVELNIGSNLLWQSPTSGQVITDDYLNISINSGVAIQNVYFDVKKWNSQTNSAGQDIMTNIAAEDIGGGFVFAVNNLDISGWDNDDYIILFNGQLSGGVDDPQWSGELLAAFVVFSIDRPLSPESLSATINSPVPNQTISGNLLFRATLNRALDSALGESALAVKIINSSGDLISQTNLEANNDGLSYQKNIDSAQQNDSGYIYPDGNYKLELFVLGSQSQLSNSLASINIFIDNEPDELELSEQVILNNPVLGSVITEDSFIVDITTLNPFNGLKIQFTNRDDGAISTNIIDVPVLDGYHWVHTLNLDNSFINGPYELIVVIHHDDTMLGSLSYNFNLNRGGEQSVIDPSSISFNLLNLDSNISGVVSPVVLSNFEFSSGDLYLQIEKTTADLAVDPLAFVRASWGTLASLGFYQGDYAATPYGYLASWDTKILPNGNYSAIARTSLDENISSETRLVSVFNNIIPEPEEPPLEEVLPEGEETNVAEQETDQNLEEAPKAEIERTSSQGKLLIRLYDSCLDVGITKEEDCLRFRAISESLDKRCISQSIFDATACEDYLNRLEIDLECQNAGIIDKEQCKDYLLEKYGSAVSCQMGDTMACNDILRNYYLNRLVVSQKRQEAINRVLEPLIGTTVTTQELGDKIEILGLEKESISVRPSSETRVFLAKSQRESVLEDSDTLTVLGQAVAILDSDGDGLPDDLELYYGTNTNNPDSDGDGYLDGIEIQNGYNPLGEGKLNLERLDLDKVILAKEPLEQPKFKSSKIDNSLDLADLENLQDRLRLRGKAQPDTWLAVYVYSDLPLVMLTKTDESGNWSYDIRHSLADGHHRVYVTVNDSTGKIVRQSRPVSFLVKGAQAVTAEDYFDDATVQNNVDSFLNYYIGGGILLILIALGVIMFLHKNKKTELGA